MAGNRTGMVGNRWADEKIEEALAHAIVADSQGRWEVDQNSWRVGDREGDDWLVCDHDSNTVVEMHEVLKHLNNLGFVVVPKINEPGKRMWS